MRLFYGIKTNSQEYKLGNVEFSVGLEFQKNILGIVHL